MSLMPTVPLTAATAGLAEAFRIVAAETFVEQLGASSSTVSTTKLGTLRSSTSTTLPTRPLTCTRRLAFSENRKGCASNPIDFR